MGGPVQGGVHGPYAAVSRLQPETDVGCIGRALASPMQLPYSNLEGEDGKSPLCVAGFSGTKRGGTGRPTL